MDGTVDRSLADGSLVLAYVSYYFLPVILGVTLYLKNPKADFEMAVFVLLFGYYVSFIGYILFPAIGPRYTLTHLQTVPLGRQCHYRFCQRYAEYLGAQQARLYAERTYSGCPHGALLILPLPSAALLHPPPCCHRSHSLYGLPPVPLCHRSLRGCFPCSGLYPHRPPFV